MRFALALALVAACGKSDPAPTAARPLDAAPAPPLPPPPPADAAPAPDARAAEPAAPDPTTEAEIEAQAEYLANMLSADEGTDRPGADLAAQIEEARRTPTADAGTVSFELSLTFADPADAGTAALAKVERVYRPGLRRCLRAATFSGGPELALTIAPAGNVTSARVSHGDPIADCVEGQMRNWRFATSERETQLILQLRVPEVR